MSAATIENLGPPTALRLLGAAMLLSLLPLFGNVSAFALVLLVGVLLYRVSGRHLARSWVRVGQLLLGVAGLAVIYAKYGRFLGMEPGISILLVLIALKVLEARNRRDFRVLNLLALFLCLTVLFYSQSLPAMLFTLALLVLALAALASLESRGALPVARALGEIGRLMAMALPVILLLFLLFPREIGLVFALRGGLFAQSGMSDRMSPGSVSSLVLSNDEAFRATFAEGTMPSQSQLYWRGAVLSQGDGLEWEPGPDLALGSEISTLRGPLVTQRILLRPHGKFWLYALDRPATDVEAGRLLPGHLLRAPERVTKRLTYTAVSRPDDDSRELTKGERALLLRVPAALSPRVQALAEDLRGPGPEPKSAKEISQAALRFFRQNKFTYTIQPGELRGDALDEFLFERRAGFCEHYAASFSTLMRLAGVPARVVIGFQGGEINREANYVIVRNSEAHAWSEVWLEGRGWERVDPTNVVAPGRLVSGLNNYLRHEQSGPATEGGLGQSSGALGLRAIWQETRLAWDGLQMKWDLYVMDYGRDQQESLLALAGFDWIGNRKLLSLMVLVLLGGALLAAAWFSFVGRERHDPVAAVYARFCRKAARRGAERAEAEGPQAFSQRLAAKFPHSASAIEAFASEYLRQRYGRPERPDVSGLRARLRGVRLRG